MSISKFYNEIKDVMDERGVETPYKKGLQLYFPNTDYTYPFKCDGYMEPCVNGNTFRLIIEYKLDELLNDAAGRAKVLIQVVWYLKMFELDGKILPNVCLVGDKNECFALQTNPLLKYLDSDVDWNTAPSQAHSNYPNLVYDISKDEEINPFVFIVNDSFSFKSVAEKIVDLAKNTQRYVRVTEHNISNIFDYFCKNVLKGKTKLNGHDLVGVFMGVLNDHDNYYIHPKKMNTLVCKGTEIHIDGNAFMSFFGYFDRNYTLQEKERMTSIADRLIEDADRRIKGDFWTPTLFVDYAHKMLENELGEDWKDEFVVWDNCWGTGNLTRDYRFNELYCSTLFQSELNIGDKYNNEAIKFQFDFLNDYIPEPNALVEYKSNLPESLINTLKQNKPIVFFLNPPYATSSSNFGAGNKSTKGVGSCDSVIKKEMVKNKMDNASKNLYAQFLYRIMRIKQTYGLTHCYIGLYSPSLFLTGPSWSVFREHFLKEFLFKYGCQFKAGHFSNVSNDWGISFTIWECGETSNKSCFNFDLIDDIDGEIRVIDKKMVYNIDGKTSAKEWIKQPIRGISISERPTLSSALSIKTGKNCKTKINQNAIGCYSNMGNNVDQNQQKVSIFTSCDSSNANGLSIMNENYERVVSLFAARRLVDKNWMNWADEYLAPDETHAKWREYVNDSIVYSIFESKSNQSSLRQIDFKEKKWNIKNEFFFMDREEIMRLAEENGFDECYNDARTSKQRYVYEKLKNITLSQKAQAVLEKAIAITRNTFRFRDIFNGLHPEYQIMNWDCGWYQIKALAKEYDKSEYEEFVKLYKALENKMRPMVYELGFLK